jgi:hypothetical protein
MIWHFTWLAPQTIIISSEGVSESRIVSVVNSCREAREIALKLQLDYYLATKHMSGGPRSNRQVLGRVKNYVNLHADTVWLTRVEKSALFPHNIYGSAVNVIRITTSLKHLSVTIPMTAFVIGCKTILGRRRFDVWPSIALLG